MTSGTRATGSVGLVIHREVPQPEPLSNSFTRLGQDGGQSIEVVLEHLSRFLARDPSAVAVGVSISGNAFTVAANKRSDLPAAHCISDVTIDDVLAESLFYIRFIEMPLRLGWPTIERLAAYFAVGHCEPRCQVGCS
jgi:hypothetical protein